MEVGDGYIQFVFICLATHILFQLMATSKWFILVKIVCELARGTGVKTLKGASILGVGFPLLVLGSVQGKRNSSRNFNVLSACTSMDLDLCASIFNF